LSFSKNNIFSLYLIMTYEQTIGSRAQVWHGTAKKTQGGLTKSHLMMNKHGRIVSRKQHHRGKSAIKRLFKLGFKPKRGTFKLFKKGHGKKMRGGEDPLNESMGIASMVPMSPMASSSRARGRASASSRSRSRKMRGGMAIGGPLSPLAYNGEGVKTSGVDLQFVAGNAA
jgi:hypothetical protein